MPKPDFVCTFNSKLSKTIKLTIFEKIEDNSLQLSIDREFNTKFKDIKKHPHYRDCYLATLENGTSANLFVQDISRTKIFRSGTDFYISFESLINEIEECRCYLNPRTELICLGLLSGGPLGSVFKYHTSAKDISFAKDSYSSTWKLKSEIEFKKVYGIPVRFDDFVIFDKCRTICSEIELDNPLNKHYYDYLSVYLGMVSDQNYLIVREYFNAFCKHTIDQDF